MRSICKASIASRSTRARRAGTAVLASAHAAGFAEAARRPALREMLEMGAFDMVALIDGGLGRLAALKPWEGCA